MLITFTDNFFILILRSFFTSFFFFNDTATTEIYTLSLHDALPTSHIIRNAGGIVTEDSLRSLVVSHYLLGTEEIMVINHTDRKSTRLNSSHGYISYAVFCLKKKKQLLIYITIIL